MARIGETRHFLEGIGYVFYGSRAEEAGGGYLETVTGWFVERTPDGKIGAAFPAKYLGDNRDEVKVAHPEIGKAMKRKGVQGW